MKTQYQGQARREQGFIIPLIIIVVAALAIGGGVYIHHKNVQKAAEVSAMASTTVETNSTTGTGTNHGTLKDLLALNQTVMCTVSSTNASSTSSGTVYISGQNMSGDFSMKMSSGTSMDSHMIKSGDTIYAWSGTQGAKIALTDVESMGTSTNMKSHATFDINQQVNYSCTPWIVDATKFTVPTTIKFVDIAAMMKAHSTIQNNIDANATVNASANVNANLPADIQAKIKAAEAAGMH